MCPGVVDKQGCTSFCVPDIVFALSCMFRVYLCNSVIATQFNVVTWTVHDVPIVIILFVHYKKTVRNKTSRVFPLQVCFVTLFSLYILLKESCLRAVRNF